MSGEGNSPELDRLIALAQERVGTLIQKPKMTEKLLSKPPFRFLHDTISAIFVATSFGTGLYDATESDSANITEKQAKISYLEKVFNLVGICQGKKLNILASKVVAGLEPEQTNQFLIALAECASNKQLDFVEAVRRTLAGEAPGSGSPPTRSNKASSSTPREEKTMENSDEKSPRKNLSSPPEMKGSESKAASVGGDGDESAAPQTERVMSRSGTRGGKPNVASRDIALSGISGHEPPKNLDAFLEKCDGSEEATQTILGDLITRPKLTSKLLSKPPFRFLHDIITEVMKVTGFAAGLYSEDEMDSSKVTEKQQKIDYLEKIIKVVGMQLNTLVEAKPAKIVAGLDPQSTNNFLQLLAVAAKHMPQSSNVVGETLNAAPKSNEPLSARPPSNEEKVVSSRKEDAQIVLNMESEPKQISSALVGSSNVSGTSPSGFKEEPRESSPNEEMKRSARPSTAGRRPPKIKENIVVAETEGVNTKSESKKPTGVILDGQHDNDDDVDRGEDQSSRLIDDFLKRSEDKATPSGNNVESKLVQDILSRQAEQQASKGSNGKKEVEVINESNNSGGIRLNRNKGKSSSNATNPSGGSSINSNVGGSSNSSQGGVSSSEAEVERLRKSIQILVQHAGPLGSCMDFIQEDVETMAAELRKWEAETLKFESLLAIETKKTKEILRPLEQELADINDQIKEKQNFVSNVKGTLIRNNQKLYETFRASASVV